MNEVKNLLKADAILDGGETVFQKVALGKCYHAILKMIENGDIEKSQRLNIMKGLELYAFNEETPLVSEDERKYYNKYKNM